VTIVESGGATQVTEGGATDTYTVALNTQPTTNVVISISPGSQVSVSPTSLTFTSATWNVAQTVTVTAVDDAVADVAQIQHPGAIGELDRQSRNSVVAAAPSGVLERHRMT